jgi:hypothetical protein
MDEAEYKRFMKSAEWTIHLSKAEKKNISGNRSFNKRYREKEGVADASRARKQTKRNEDREARVAQEQAANGAAAQLLAGLLQLCGNQ